MSKSTKQHPDNSGNHVDLWPLKIAKARSNDLTLLKIPLCNTAWSALHKHQCSSNRTENGKCTNITNSRSRVGLVNSILHKPASITRRQICFSENFHCPAYLRTYLCLITDRTNQRSWQDAGQIYVISMEFSAVNSPLQKREGTGASLLYWLDWKSKH